MDNWFNFFNAEMDNCFMKKLSYTLIITSLMMVLTGCSSSEQLSSSSPNNGYYPQPSNTFYDAYPHKDRYDPTSKMYLPNGEENPNYTSPYEMMK